MWSILGPYWSARDLNVVHSSSTLVRAGPKWTKKGTRLVPRTESWSNVGPHWSELDQNLDHLRSTLVRFGPKRGPFTVRIVPGRT